MTSTTNNERIVALESDKISQLKRKLDDTQTNQKELNAQIEELAIERIQAVNGLRHACNEALYGSPLTLIADKISRTFDSKTLNSLLEQEAKLRVNNPENEDIVRYHKQITDIDTKIANIYKLIENLKSKESDLLAKINELSRSALHPDNRALAKTAKRENDDFEVIERPQEEGEKKSGFIGQCREQFRALRLGISINKP
jgi:hypothetical protein